MAYDNKYWRYERRTVKIAFLFGAFLIALTLTFQSLRFHSTFSPTIRVSSKINVPGFGLKTLSGKHGAVIEKGERFDARNQRFAIRWQLAHDRISHQIQDSLNSINAAKEYTHTSFGMRSKTLTISGSSSLLCDKSNTLFVNSTTKKRT
jgi:hypothetical protein